MDFFNENIWISITTKFKFVPKCQINTIPALVQIMAWRQIGNKPIIWISADLIQWRIYGALGGDESMQ